MSGEHSSLIHILWAMRTSLYRHIANVPQAQGEQYNLLFSLQTALLSFIHDGVSARDIYQFALNYVKERQPELEKHLVKNIGFAVCPNVSITT